NTSNSAPFLNRHFPATAGCSTNFTRSSSKPENSTAANPIPRALRARSRNFSLQRAVRGRRARRHSLRSHDLDHLQPAQPPPPRLASSSPPARPPFLPCVPPPPRSSRGPGATSSRFTPFLLSSPPH